MTNAPEQEPITLDAPVVRIVDNGLDLTLKLRSREDIAIAMSTLERVAAKHDDLSE